MTEPTAASTPAPVEPKAPTEPAAAPKPGFAFTDPGCRSEIRLGALMVLVGVFMWGWLGPGWASPLAWLGVPLVLVGVVLQVRDAKRDGRPGYPWKLGVALGIGGVLMALDLTYRERYDGPLHLQLTAILLCVPGLWILAWWPVARRAAAPLAKATA